ncbi:hypothetical protein V6N13_040376 [Hibiscus sabdariffa]
MDEDTSTWLIGSVITPKAVDGEAITRIFRSVWKPKNITEITELRSNLFLIKPSSVGVTDTILKRQPWVLDDDLFAIESYNPEWRADDYTFRCLPIWVRVYKLPLQAMNGEMGLRLGSCIGRALGVDHRVEGGNKGDFLRVRVEIDIQKPLRRCVMLVKPDGFDGKKLQYGSWLRVPDQQPRSKARRRLGVEYFSEASQPAPPTTSTTCKGKAASSSQAPPPTDDTVHPGRGTTTVTDTGTLNARHPGVASETNEAVNDQKKSVVLTEGTRDIESAVAPPTRTSKRTLQDASCGRLKGDYFRFEDCWSKEPACVERVRSVWEGTSGPTLHKLQAVGSALRGWQAEHRNSSRHRISELHSFIDSCMQGPLCASDRAAFLVAKKEHKALLEKEEAYWAQRS